MQLPAYTADGQGGRAQPHRRAERDSRARRPQVPDARARRRRARRGEQGSIVYKSVLLVDVAGATNLAGSEYETTAASLLQDPAGTALAPGVVPAEPGRTGEYAQPRPARALRAQHRGAVGEVGSAWISPRCWSGTTRPTTSCSSATTTTSSRRSCRMSGQVLRLRPSTTTAAYSSIALRLPAPLR